MMTGVAWKNTEIIWIYFYGRFCFFVWWLCM